MELLEKNIDRLARSVALRSGRLIGKIAASNGSRRPVGWAADVFFLGIVDGLESEKVSRKVTADMFGVSPRTLHRKINEAGAGNVDQPDWIKLNTFVRENGPLSRQTLMAEFPGIAVETMASLIRDLIVVGAIEESEGQLRYSAGSRTLGSSEMEELIVRMHHYFEMPADQIAPFTGWSIDQVEEVLARPIAQKWEVDKNTVWVLLSEAVNRSFDFLEGRVMGNADDHKGIVLNLRIDTLSVEAREKLRQVVQECVARLQTTVNTYGDVNQPYPSALVAEWSVVMMENFDSELDLTDE